MNALYKCEKVKWRYFEAGDWHLRVSVACIRHVGPFVIFHFLLQVLPSMESAAFGSFSVSPIDRMQVAVGRLSYSGILNPVLLLHFFVKDHAMSWLSTAILNLTCIV